MKRTFENELEKCRILIFGVLGNQSIKERIAQVYSEERLANGVELYQAAKAASEAQSIEKLESMEATKTFVSSRDAIHQSLIRLRQSARYFFKNDYRLLKLLQMDQEVPAAYAAWKVLAETSFRAALSNAEIIQKLGLAGITSEMLNTSLTQLTQLEQQRLNAEKEDGEAQQASIRKQETFEELKAYCIDLRECLNLFFEGSDRQKLEEVGITVK